VSRGALQGEAARLEEIRLNVLEERIDLDLQLGRNAEVIAELAVLRAAWPFRQRPIGRLMLALYRTGRQAEALQVYRDARRLFIAELGLEPGPDLQRLESALLKADPSLDL
jgi:DNA-binding SARP family transcriptional activator